MFKGEIKSHLIVTLVWLGIVGTVAVLRGSLGHFSNWIFFFSGGILGTFLLDIDHLIYTFIIYPYEFTSSRVKRLFDQREFKKGLILLAETHFERNRLSFHNAFFQLIFYIICFFVLSSTRSYFGKSLVMAMALHLLKDELESLFFRGDEFTRKWLFWPLKREISFQNQRFFIIFTLFVFLCLNLFLV